MKHTCKICKENKEEDSFTKCLNKTGKWRIRTDACKKCKCDREKLRRSLDPSVQSKSNESQKRHRKTLKGKIGMLTQAARDRSKKSGLYTDISYTYVRDLWDKQQGLCAYSRKPMTWDGTDRWSALSLDRIDPALGYVEGNIQLLTMRVNSMKSNMTEEDFFTLCKTIVNQSPETIENTP